MRVVFFGSGSFAVPSFEALVQAGLEVVAVVTQPDRPQGRGMAVRPPPLKPVAEAHRVDVLQPARARAPEVETTVRALRPEIQVVVAYGQILPKGLIEVPPHGTVNVHGSLLPQLRGAAPVQWAIARGHAETGVTTMLIDEGLDTGPILLARSTPILDTETADELAARLASLGGELLVETVAGVVDGSIVPRPQDGAQATYAPLIRKEDGRLAWNEEAPSLARRMRAFHPWPGTFTLLSGHVLKVRSATVEAGEAHAAPGTILHVQKAGVLVACGGGTALRVETVQPESRRAMDAFAWATGARILAGQRFDP